MLSGSPHGAILPPWVAEPYRLVSLWEIMRQFKPELFVPLSQIITIWRMTPESKVDAGLVPNEAIPTVDSVLFTFANELEEIGLPVSLIAARRALAYVREGAPSWSRLKELTDVTEQRVNDEMQSVLFFSVQPQLSKFYASPRTGWEGAIEAFPSIVRDVEEAGKCFAFNRSTATVFHLMRITEAGVESVGRRLGIPYAPSWESYLGQMRKLMEKEWKDKEPEWKSDEPFFRDVLGHLQTVKLAWRNPTMHIVRSYNQEEAEEVYDSVRAFMRHLSAKLSEVPP